jgi:hypothetical protein
MNSNILAIVLDITEIPPASRNKQDTVIGVPQSGISLDKADGTPSAVPTTSDQTVTEPRTPLACSIKSSQNTCKSRWGCVSEGCSPSEMSFLRDVFGMINWDGDLDGFKKN